MVDYIPDFAVDAEQYLFRQRMLPTQFTDQLESLIKLNRFVDLDDKIHGLRAVSLDAPQGGEESLLAVDRTYGRRRIVILASIFNHRVDQLAWQSKSQMCKQRINLAVAKLIATARNGDLYRGLLGAVG